MRNPVIITVVGLVLGNVIYASICGTWEAACERSYFQIAAVALFCLNCSIFEKARTA